MYLNGWSTVNGPVWEGLRGVGEGTGTRLGLLYPLQGLEKPVDWEPMEAGPTSRAFLREFLSPTFSIASDSVWE